MGSGCCKREDTNTSTTNGSGTTTTITTTTVTGTDDLSVFRREGLAAHNRKRNLHGSQAVKFSVELNDMAQKWAEYLANSGKFEHSPDSHRKGAGENLAAHTNSISAERVIDMWYNEINQYDFNQPGFSSTTGHFTQVVWANCTHIGMGMSPNQGASGMYIFVANYWPHGNVSGQFETNVLPPH